MSKKLLVVFCNIFITSCFSQYNYKLWSTYYFGIDTKTSDAKLDSEGNLVVAGTTFLQQPAEYYETFTTMGCHQSSFEGTMANGFICKFSSGGNLLWATYYGNNNTAIFGLALDSANNIYVVGGTSAETGIATPDAFIVHNETASRKGFLSKFDTEGQLIWGTYFPAPISAICITGNDEIFVTGDNDLNDPDNYIATLDGWQPTWSTYTDVESGFANNINGFINKFDTSGSRLAGTFIGHVYGGNNYITSDDNGDVYVSNLIIDTYAPSGFYASAGCHQAIIGGAEDIVISKFNSSLNQRIWSTYYGGSSYDSCSGLMIKNETLYVVGNTLSAINISSTGSFQPQINGFADGFLATFDLSGQRIWSTYFGGEAFDSILGLDVSNSHIIIAGQTTSVQSIAVDSAYQESIINDEGYIEVFTLSGLREWGTYFGGERSDNVKKVLASNDIILIAGDTNSTSGISTAQSAQSALSMGSYTGTENFTNMYLATLSSVDLGLTTKGKIQLKLSPNPNNGLFELEGMESLDEFRLIIYDNLDREILWEKSTVVGTSAVPFDFTGRLAAGSYFLKVSTNNQDSVLKFIVY